MQKYGARYKVNGPPVNVPTTLNQVTDMLSRMPQQLDTSSQTENLNIRAITCMMLFERIMLWLH